MNKVLLGALLMLSMVVLAFCSSNDASLGDGLFARINTNRGDIVLRLEYEKTPMTVTNFVALAEGRMDAAGGRPYYNGLTFHRVIDDFVIQGGCPQGTGAGGPGYNFPDEIDPDLIHDGPGILSMANAGPGTNGSQFFITHTATPWLDGRHTVFGRVVQGQNVVNAIQQGDRMNSITIIRNGTQANAFMADQETFDALVHDVSTVAYERTMAQREEVLAEINGLYPNALVTESGIRYIVQTTGRGPKPEAGSEVSVKYKGMFLSGEVFDDSEQHGQHLEFPVGVGIIMSGIDEAVSDMTLGEIRTVILPPELAFGDRGVDNFIPPNSFVVFEFELLEIK